ncbi:hypothetical protein [Cellulosilyticum sp. I15G10I2]|uniref:hypothetical protein n=1 Tax=Cellulosilyticum sp. I15G10I2 TaxID=1892843 RepID=UPI00085BEC03|nr:hypothetical protein [Cellulosilyticum sp. I15G10I2]
MEYNKLLMLITIIFSLVILIIGIADFVKKKYSFFIENLVSYTLYLIFLAAQYKFEFYARPFIITLALITIIGNNLIGKYLNYYYRSKYYDRFLHAFGAFSYALFFYEILNETITPTIHSRLYVSIFVATIGISYGCVYEIYEFILDSISNSDNQHGLIDTNFDLISNIIGSIIAGIISVLVFF